MNYVTVNPRRRRKSSDYMFPHLGNILNEVMRSNVSDIIKQDSETIKYTVPAVNIREYSDQFVLSMAIPGMSKKDISIDVEKDKLIISSDIDIEGTATKFSLREFNYSKFKRTFVLPDTVDQESIEARFKNGLLNVVIAKKEVKAETGPQKIKIS